MSERLQHAAFDRPHVASGSRRLLRSGFRVVEGDPADSRTVIIEFPSRDEFRAWYDSPAYREVLPLRLESVPGTVGLGGDHRL